jgi:hypothetical protein
VAALQFLEDSHAMYLGADTTLRRQINQALFNRIYIERSGGIRADLTEPFSTLLSRPVRELVAANSEAGHVVDWKSWEDSFNDNTRGDTAGVGLSHETMVGGTGLEAASPGLHGSLL